MFFAIASSVMFGSGAAACPFCNAVSQTLRQEMEAMDAVVVAKSLDTDATRDAITGEITMKITSVLKGESLVQVGDEVVVVYYGEVGTDRPFMLSGVDPPELLWSCLPLTEGAAEYVKKIPQLGEDPIKRLSFYYDYLQSDDSMLSRDAYDEFAITPYETIIEMAPKISRDDLISWLNDPELLTDRKRLYLTLLGVVGSKDDLPMLEKMLRSTQKSTRGGLDALIACYLTLAGEPGLPMIEDLFLANTRASYTDTYSAVMALRFHGTEGNTIARSALSTSLHHLLDRPELADLVIPDLARWNDWSVIEKVTSLFVDSDPENNWIRVPVVNYLRACPLPEAEKAIEKLTELDPEAVRRANTFYSIPVPVREVPGDQSRIERSGPTDPFKRIEAFGSFVADPLLPVTGRLVVHHQPLAATVRRGNVGSSAGRLGIVAQQPVPAVNRWRMASVMTMATATAGLSAWLILTGGGVDSRA